MAASKARVQEFRILGTRGEPGRLAPIILGLDRCQGLRGVCASRSGRFLRALVSKDCEARRVSIEVDRECERMQDREVMD